MIFRKAKDGSQNVRDNNAARVAGPGRICFCAVFTHQRFPRFAVNRLYITDTKYINSEYIISPIRETLV